MKENQGRMTSYQWGSRDYTKEKQILNNLYSFVCNYPINILFGYIKEFCRFKEG